MTSRADMTTLVIATRKMFREQA